MKVKLSHYQRGKKRKYSEQFENIEAKSVGKILAARKKTTIRFGRNKAK